MAYLALNLDLSKRSGTIALPLLPLGTLRHMVLCGMRVSLTIKLGLLYSIFNLLNKLTKTKAHVESPTVPETEASMLYYPFRLTVGVF